MVLHSWSFFRMDDKGFFSIPDEFGAKHVFFVDMCGAYARLDEMKEVVAELDKAGQDVQLHAHPEYLPESFWPEHNLSFYPQYMNEYDDDSRAEFVLRHFAGEISAVTCKPILAYRAGSFRWNASAIRALASLGIPLSFNNSAIAMHNGQCLYSRPENQPFTWANGVVEIPVTEQQVLFKKKNSKDLRCRLQYPESRYLRLRRRWASFLPFSVDRSEPLLVYLLHSWSLLHWDENGYGVYVDDQRMEGYRKLLKRLSKDYDIITCPELMELLACGKITPTHTEGLEKAELGAKQ